MAPIPLPRRGFRSVILLGLMLWSAYLVVKRLNRVSATRYIESQRPGGAVAVRPLDALGNYQGKGRDIIEAALEREDAFRRRGAQKPLRGAAREREELLRNTPPPGAELAEGEKKKKSKRLPEHDFLENGLLRVNPQGQHPIYDLLAHGKQEWRRKVGKASKTLKQAVDEYRRRYGRAPPKGFDRWWEYAVKHNIQLPDEYDQIFHDLEPFHALTSATIRKLVSEAGGKDGMYTISCRNGKCTPTINEKGLNEEGRRVAKERAEEQLGLLRDVQADLEEVDAVFYSHDVPWQFVGHEYKSALEDAASVGEYYNTDEHELDWAHLGWASACAPHKELREMYDASVYPNLDNLWQEPDKSFVWNHKASMDPCTHPTITHLQGFLSSHGKGPGPSKELYPAMAMCKTMIHSDILAVSMEAWTEDVADDPAWEDKKEDKLLWRGKTTGTYFKKGIPWEISQRINLVSRTAASNGKVPVLSLTAPSKPVGDATDRTLATLNSDLVDVAFVDDPIQCDPQECAKIRKDYKFGNRINWKQGNEYKYLLDIDGNGWSARFKRLMTTNSVVLKSTIFPEWYTDRIQPWLHYIPIKSDLTDLYDVLTFFRGHDNLAKQIAVEGKKWSQTFWRREDMVSYQFRLMLELSRLMAPDRDQASFDVIGKQLE